MLKRPSFLLLTLAILVGIGLFRVKYEVIALEANHMRIKHEIKENKEAIHVLKAEFAHLTEPKRLQALCQKYLPELKSVRSTQLMTLHDMTNTPAITSALETQPEAAPSKPAPKMPSGNFVQNTPDSLDLYMNTIETKEFSL